MKRVIAFFISIICLFPTAMRAQENAAEEVSADTLKPLQTWRYGTWGMGYGLHNGMMLSYPLHYGFNAEVEAGVRVGWGRHNPWRGASFFTNLAALYAMPLSKDGRWTAAIGGFYGNDRIWGQRVNSLGLMGMVDYRINERLNLTGFVAHDFGIQNVRMPGMYGLYGLNYGLWGPGCGLGLGPATTVGADLGIKVTEKFALSFGISFTRQQYDFPFETIIPPPRANQHALTPPFQ